MVSTPARASNHCAQCSANALPTGAMHARLIRRRTRLLGARRRRFRLAAGKNATRNKGVGLFRAARGDPKYQILGAIWFGDVYISLTSAYNKYFCPHPSSLEMLKL